MIILLSDIMFYFFPKGVAVGLSFPKALPLGYVYISLSGKNRFYFNKG